MNEAKAREILGEMITPENKLWDAGYYVWWSPHDEEATLDGSFDAATLSAIAWWMENKKK
jgi:hypothetical protein